MFDEVLEENAPEYDEFRNKALLAAGALAKLLAHAHPDVEIHSLPKRTGSVVLTNAGGRTARHKFIAALADKGVVEPNKKDLKDGRLYYKGTINGINFELRRGNSRRDAPTATEFEDFLAAAIGNNPEKLKQKYVQKYSKDIVNTYLEIATNIIAGAGNKLKGRKVTKLSGGGNRCKLTQRYAKFKVESREPKTDFKVGADRVSVKRKGSSQYTSAQFAEAAAMVDYVLLKQRSDKEVRTFVKNLIKSSLNKDEFYKLRDKRANTEGTTCKTNFDKLLTAHIFAVPTENAEYRKELASFVEEIGIQTSEEVLKKYQTILSKEDFKKGLLHEAMTGGGKFGVNSPCTATYLLEWDKDDPPNTEYAEITDALIDDKVTLTKFRIADRGDGRGGCVRLDALKEYVAGTEYAQLVSTPASDLESTRARDYKTLEDYLEAYFSLVVPIVENQIDKLEGLDLLNFFGDQIKFELEWKEPLSLISDD